MQVEAMQAERDHPHDIWVIFEPEAEIGFMYTSGLAAVAASNIELIALDVQRHSVPSFSNCLNFLGSRLKEGHAILPGQKVMREAGTTQDYMNMIVGVDESTNRYLLAEVTVMHVCGFTLLSAIGKPLLTATFVNYVR